MEPVENSDAKAAGAMTPGQQDGREHGGRREKRGCLFVWLVFLFLYVGFAFFILIFVYVLRLDILRIFAG